MKKSYIIVIVLVLIAVVAFFMMKSKTLEAPTPEESSAVNEGLPDEEAGTPAVKEFTVSGQNFSFSPSTIAVKKGDRVKITFNNTQGFHDFVIDEYGAATKQTNAPTTEVLEFTADKAGTFEYYCSVGSHRAMGMKGTLVVE